MPWPFGPSPKRVREDIGRLGGWLKKYAEGRIEDMRSPSDLPRALLNPNDPESRAELQNFAINIVGGINPASRASKMLRVEHYSAKPGLRTLDPKYAGTGRTGREVRRTGRPKAVHVYDQKAGRVEPEFRNDYRYVAEVPADKIYDVSDDAAGIVARLSKNGTRGVDADAMERAIQKAGYLGYRSTFDAPETIKLFGKLDVTPAGPRKIKGQTFGAKHPPIAPPKYPAVKLPGDRLFSTPNSTHAGIILQLQKSGKVDPTDLATAVNNMDEHMGFVDRNRNFLTRQEARARADAAGMPKSPWGDFDSYELPHMRAVSEGRAAGAGTKGDPIVREHNPLKVGTLAKQLLKTIQDNRAGFSVKLAGKELQPATTGYAVGAGGVNKNTLTVPLDKLNLRQLTKWMKANPDAWRKGVLGGWVDDAGNAVIEPSTLVDDLATATRLGRERGEQAVGDLAKYARGEDGTISLAPPKPLVRTVGEDFGADFLHGTSAKNINNLLNPETATTGVRAGTGNLAFDAVAPPVQNEFKAAMYLSEARQPQQAVMFASGKGDALAVVSLKPGSRILDLSDEAARAPRITLGDEPRLLRFFERPAITDDFISWHKGRVSDGYKRRNPNWETDIAERFDPASPKFDPESWAENLVEYAKDRGFAAVRFADETLLADRTALAGSRKATAAELAAARKTRTYPPSKNASLMTDQPTGARAEAESWLDKHRP